jgi:hypothetical protein
MKDEVVIAVADATKEVAKTAHKTPEVIEESGAYFANIVGTVPQDVIGVVGDQLRHFRMRNYARLEKETQNLVKRLGFEGRWRTVSPSFFIEWRDAATLAEDEGLVKIWTALFAAAANPKYDLRQDQFLITVIRDLLPEDARAFQLIYDLSTTGYDGIRLPPEEFRSVRVPYLPSRELPDRGLNEGAVVDLSFADFTSRVGSVDVRGIVEKLVVKGLAEVPTGWGGMKSVWMAELAATETGCKIYYAVRQHTL